MSRLDIHCIRIAKLYSRVPFDCSRGIPEETYSKKLPRSLEEC